MAVETCYIPQNLEEALEIRKTTGAHPLAGGSDLMVAYKIGQGCTPKFPWPIMIITNLPELKRIEKRPDGTVIIGALTTSAEIAASDLVPYHVKKAASLMGAVSLRNSATIGGNIGNASPKGDLPQPLVLLDADVVLASVGGERIMKLDEFILGSKKTALRDDEIIEEIRIPEVQLTHLFYHKIGTRHANAISKLTLSMGAYVEDGILKDFRACSGAAGPKVRRSREAEKLLIGLKVEEIPDHIAEFAKAWDGIISPHAMPEYRRNSTRRMIVSFLEKLAHGAEPGIYE